MPFSPRVLADLRGMVNHMCEQAGLFQYHVKVSSGGLLGTCALQGETDRVRNEMMNLMMDIMAALRPCRHLPL